MHEWNESSHAPGLLRGWIYLLACGKCASSVPDEAFAAARKRRRVVQLDGCLVD